MVSVWAADITPLLIEEIYQSFKELIEPLHKENTNKRKKYKL